MRSFILAPSLAQPSAALFASEALRRWEDDGDSQGNPHLTARNCPATEMDLPIGLVELMTSLMMFGGVAEEEIKKAARSWLDIFNRSGQWLLKSQGRWASDTR